MFSVGHDTDVELVTSLIYCCLVWCVLQLSEAGILLANLKVVIDLIIWILDSTNEVTFILLFLQFLLVTCNVWCLRSGRPMKSKWLSFLEGSQISMNACVPMKITLAFFILVLSALSWWNSVQCLTMMTICAYTLLAFICHSSLSNAYCNNLFDLSSN